MNRNTIFILLLLSLAANAAMLVALGTRPSVDWRHVFGGDSVLGPRVSRSSSTVKSGGAQVHSGAAAAMRAKLWSALQSDDLRGLMDQLRVAGFPAMIIRAIIAAQVDARLARRSDEILGPVEALPFWKSDSFNGLGYDSDPKKAEAFQQLYRERSRQLRELLGDDIDAYYADPTAEQRRRFGNLSSAKIDRVQRIVDDYDEMMSQLRAAGGGVTLPEDRAKLKLLEQEKAADLAATLTSQERDDYEMRNDYITMRLRGAMILMDATEDEFRAIFRAQKAYETEMQTMRTSDAFAAGAFSNEPSPRQLQLQQEIKAVLGEQRYAEYSRASNNEFQTLTRLAQRENLPGETAVRVFSVRDGVAQESNRIYADAALTFEQKRDALQALALQTRTQILSALGPAAGPAYVQSLRWLTLVERGSAVTFGPENRTSSKKLVDPSASGARPGN